MAEDVAAAGPAEPVPLRNRARTVRVGIAVLLACVAGAALLYFGRDSSAPAGVSPGTGPGSSSPAPGPAKPLKALSDEQLERMVAQAAAQTRKEPRNASAWAMLAHSYEMLGKFSESVQAYKSLEQLLPNDAQVLADYADVLAVANGRSFKGEPSALIKRALAIDPKNAKALVLAGSAAMEEPDYARAISHFGNARAASTDAAFLRQIDASIAQAKALLSGGGPPQASSAPVEAKAGPVPVVTGAAAQVSGRVWLAEGLRARAPAQATLFLFARPVDGSRMPVALLRKKVADLPLEFTLDDSMSMVPDVRLSKLPAVVVVARISMQGNVTPAPGDLEGVSAPVPVGTKNLKLEITEVLK